MYITKGRHFLELQSRENKKVIQYTSKVHDLLTQHVDYLTHVLAPAGRMRCTDLLTQRYRTEADSQDRWSESDRPPGPRPAPGGPR